VFFSYEVLPEERAVVMLILGETLYSGTII
jgi:hypothetical protein